MSLVALQRAFQAHLLSGDDTIAALVDPAMRRGLPVYGYAYRATLRAALRDIFEKTLLWLGDAAFDAAADAYIDATPSSSWTLSDYGGGFPAALTAKFVGDAEVGELAWLDWALRHAFSAAGVPATDPTQLAATDWERAHLELAAHVGFRRIRTNVIEVWNGLPDTPLAAAALDPPIGLVVWRSGLSPEFRSADLVEIDAMQALVDGMSFAQMCAALAEGGADAGGIGQMLGRWLDDELVAVVA